MIDTQAACTDIFEPGLIPVETARHYILNKVLQINESECLPIEHATHRILGEEIIAPFNVPPHTNSAVDGYALHSEDLPSVGEKQLNIQGYAFAGQPYTDKTATGACIRIMTGAPLPSGLDTVIMQEHVSLQGDVITIDTRHKAGQNIRKAGEDIKQGQAVLLPGRYLTPADIGLCASMGICEIKVKRRLRCAIASTGNEVCSPGEQVGQGGIYDSNRYSLLAALDRPSIETIDLGIIADNEQALLSCFNEASKYADLIISSGGVSVGEADYTKSALKENGQINFWKVAIKPGRPLAFGKLNDTDFFGLPGNPVAVMVTFYQFVLPAIETILGISNQPMHPTLLAKCTESLRKRSGRTEVQRGIIEQDKTGQWWVKSTGKQGSGILTSMTQGNAFIILEHERSNIQTGELVTVQPFAGLL